MFSCLVVYLSNVKTTIFICKVHITIHNISAKYFTEPNIFIRYICVYQEKSLYLQHGKQLND